MRRSPFLFLLAALILGVAVAGVLLYRDWNSPGYALRQLARNITDRKYNEIYDYLDMSAILEGLIREAGQDLAAGLGPERKNLLDRLGPVVGGRLAGHLLPRMAKGAEKPMRSLLEEYLRTLTPAELQSLEEAVRHPEIQMDKNGQVAQVVLQFSGGAQRLRLTMRRSQGKARWRVTGISYQDILRILEKPWR